MRLNEISKPTYRIRGRERLVKILHEFLLAQAREWGAKTQYANPDENWTDVDKLADHYDRLTQMSLRTLLPEMKEKSDELARDAGWNRD